MSELLQAVAKPWSYSFLKAWMPVCYAASRCADAASNCVRNSLNVSSDQVRGNVLHVHGMLCWSVTAFK